MKTRCIPNRIWAAATALLTLLALAAPARTDLVTSDPSLPPLFPAGYYTNHLANISYAGPGVIVTLTNVGHLALGPVNRSQSGPDEIEQFNSQLNGQGAVLGLGPLSVTANGLVSTIVHGKIGNTTGTFNTEMLAMNLSGVSPFGPFMIRESPTLPSLGVTSVTALGGGLYNISSFFDVFTELSLDGGITWVPDSNGPERVTLVPVPEPSICALGGLAAGLLALRRRQCSGKPS